MRKYPEERRKHRGERSRGWCQHTPRCRLRQRELIHLRGSLQGLDTSGLVRNAVVLCVLPALAQDRRAPRGSLSSRVNGLPGLLGAGPELRPARAKRDEKLRLEIERVWDENLAVYGADKVWRQLLREGFEVERCTVER
jgi:hypothetical protein